MTGVLKQNEGKIKIMDLSVESEMEEIRKVVGVCPQFDILWNELSAREHLILFNNLKQFKIEDPDYFF